jgi:hypothetical protein
MTAHSAECATNGMFPGVKGQGTPGEQLGEQLGEQGRICTIKESSNVLKEMALPLT